MFNDDDTLGLNFNNNTNSDDIGEENIIATVELTMTRIWMFRLYLF